MLNHLDMACLFKGQFPEYSCSNSSIYLPTFNAVQRHQSSPRSISHWLPRHTVPPAGHGSPCSFPLFGHMWTTRRHSGLITPSDQNSSAASTRAVQQLCFLSEVSPDWDPIARPFFLLLIPHAKLPCHELVMNPTAVLNSCKNLLSGYMTRSSIDRLISCEVSEKIVSVKKKTCNVENVFFLVDSL